MNNRLTIAAFAALIATLASCGEAEAVNEARAEPMLIEIDDKRNADHKAMPDAFQNMGTGKKKQPSTFDNPVSHNK